MAAVKSFARARGAIDDGLNARAFPGAVAEVGRASGRIWTHAAGRLTLADDAPVVTLDTIFDLASLTKVLSTAAIALRLVHREQLDVEAPLRTLVPEWPAKGDHARVTVRDLLEHCSGLPAHRKYFLSLAGRAAYQQAICAEPLAYLPRSEAIYSDPGFILLGFILEDAGERPLDEQFNQWRDNAGIDEPIRFNPPEEWRPRTAPTEHDPWRGRLLVGEVHDENAAALGGVAGHAGLFGTAAAVGACARWWLSLLTRAVPARIDATADQAAAFATRTRVAGSSRALAWDTMLPTSSCGTRLSPRAIGHTGFTGTSLWIDPDRDLYFVLLTNRVHPSRANTAIQAVRRAFHDAAVADLQEPA